MDAHLLFVGVGCWIGCFALAFYFLWSGFLFFSQPFFVVDTNNAGHWCMTKFNTEKGCFLWIPRWLET